MIPTDHNSDSAVTPNEEFIPTRASLLSRLKDISRDDCWKEFFDTYWKLIYNSARKSGLSDAEAQDVVQETMVTITTRIKTFKYDPERGTFKNWLMRLTQWRIIDQVRKRQKAQPLNGEHEMQMDESDFLLDWEKDWQSNIAAEALRRVRNRATPRTFQAFLTSVAQNRGARETAKLLRMSVPAVYMATYTVSQQIKREVEKLEKAEF
jgi:RNA polymerase sigma factor (sigma-70 family)